ncbi:MAG: terminase large subunit domain-containing protein [Brevundimonas sp.]
MSEARWRSLLERWLAGEDQRALQAEFGVSASAVHWNAKRLGLRKKDRPDAVRRPKGPPPVGVIQTGRGPAMACGDVCVRFDFDDPCGALGAIAGEMAEAGEVGDLRRADRLYRCGGQLVGMRKWMDAAARRWGEKTPDVEAAPAVAATALGQAQTPPDGDWRTWLFLGGRGAGKTRAGAEWLADQAHLLGRGGRLALIGPTLHDVREVMINGASGILGLPRWTDRDRPTFEVSRRRLKFANGCVAYVFSAEEPERLRGPQFSAAWADEFCAWKGTGEETLALLRMGLRVPLRPHTRHPGASRSEEPGTQESACSPWVPGSASRPRDDGVSRTAPRLVVTTTPKPTRALKRLRAEASCVETHATTADNAANLSGGFVDGLRDLYGGTRREAQELEGRVVDLDGALFTAEMMMGARAYGAAPSTAFGGPPPPMGEELDRANPPPRGRGTTRSVVEGASPSTFHRIVVAIDPPATATGDACGIVAVGARLRADGIREAVVLADRSARGLSPEGWARRARDLAAEVGAHALVAEVNQGGDMVKSVLKAAGVTLPLRSVRATRGKALRAEPVAALYEQGRIRHAVPVPELEEELMAMGAEDEGSLDRADALVWAVTDLLVARTGEGPRARWV